MRQMATGSGPIRLPRSRFVTPARLQRLTLSHTCDVWAEIGVTDPLTGKRTTTLSKVLSGVACLYRYNPNVDDSTPVGRSLRSTILTTDIVYFATEAPIENGWWLKNTTRDRDGQPGKNAGQIHKLLGAPQQLAETLTEVTDYQGFMAMVDENAPDEIKVG